MRTIQAGNQESKTPPLQVCPWRITYAFCPLMILGTIVYYCKSFICKSSVVERERRVETVTGRGHCMWQAFDIERYWTDGWLKLCPLWVFGAPRSSMSVKLLVTFPSVVRESLEKQWFHLASWELWRSNASEIARTFSSIFDKEVL